MVLKKSSLFFIVGLLNILAIALPVAAQSGDKTAGRDPKFEQEIYDRLSAINPEAVPLFQAATQAMDARDYESAKQGFDQVLSLAPDFPDALRRLSYVDLALQDPQSAILHASQAFEADGSAYSRTALARALLESGDEANIKLALEHARGAIIETPDDPYANMVFMLVAAQNGELESVRQSSARLIKLAPDNPYGHYFAGVVAIEDNQWVKAEDELLLAKKLGISEDKVNAVLEQADIHRQAQNQRILRWVVYALLVVFSLLVILLVLRYIKRRQRSVN